MNLKKLTFTLAMALSTSVFAQNTHQNHSLNREDAMINVSQIQKQFTLKKPTEDSPTRISLVVVDLGGSTDMSAKMALYLTFHQDGEQSNADSAFFVGVTFQLIDFEDNGNGLLEMKSKDFNSQGRFVTQTITIDYKDFSKKFEEEAATLEEEFVDEWVNGTVLETIR